MATANDRRITTGADPAEPLPIDIKTNRGAEHRSHRRFEVRQLQAVRSNWKSGPSRGPDEVNEEAPAMNAAMEATEFDHPTRLGSPGSTCGWRVAWRSWRWCGPASLRPAQLLQKRALVRIATPATEPSLVDLARSATAGHMDRIARARRSIHVDDEARQPARRHESRHLHWFRDENGSLVLTARLRADEGCAGAGGP